MKRHRKFTRGKFKELCNIITVAPGVTITLDGTNHYMDCYTISLFPCTTIAILPFGNNQPLPISRLISPNFLELFFVKENYYRSVAKSNELTYKYSIRYITISVRFPDYFG